jgi:hypothetical protein
LQSLLINQPELREITADVSAALHLTNGKAQIPSSWAGEMKTALDGIGMALNGVVGDGWSEGEYSLHIRLMG